MHLHILSFDVPYPPTYGGVIEVYAKLRALHKAGGRIHLHCFAYGRPPAPALEDLCEEVHYYPRKSLLASLPLAVPHIVKSRRSTELLERLMNDSYPILFEGLHTCFYLDTTYLAYRQKLVRMHNVEWQYYHQLAQREGRFAQKNYLLLESQRLQAFEARLSHADQVLCISPNDHRYYAQRFQQASYLPAFHLNDQLASRPGKGTYCLYHAKLSVPENHEAAMFLIHEVFAHLNVPLIIAGAEPLPALIEAISAHEHITLRHNPGQGEMHELIRQAHVHVLPSFQATGIKLKLLTALFNGRFCLVNEPMVAHTGLEPYCLVAYDAQEFRALIVHLFSRAFTQAEIDQRKQLLGGTFSNQANAQQLLALLEPA